MASVSLQVQYLGPTLNMSTGNIVNKKYEAFLISSAFINDHSKIDSGAHNQSCMNHHFKKMSRNMRTCLIKIKRLRESSNIKLPSSWITNPTFTFLCWIPVFAPNRVRQNLEYLLRLRVTIRIRWYHRFLQVHCISWSTIEKVRIIGELGRIGSVNSGAI